MGSRLSPNESRLYRMCDEALFYVWDPIGVCDAPEARSEYETYVPRVFGLVKSGARDELIAYLMSIVDQQMELRASEERATTAADFMLRGRAWIERTFPD
jgi:hypothetical protein